MSAETKVQMTKLEAVKKLVAQFTVRAKQTYCDYDPAGSTTEYEPDPEDLAVLSAMIGREVIEADLWFNVGTYGHNPPRFMVLSALVDEVSL